MLFKDALSITPGVTAFIGGGGKTSLISRIASELMDSRVIITSTAKMWPPADIPTLLSPTKEDILLAISKANVICVGVELENKKLSWPKENINMLSGIADYILVEADGSKGFPLKAYADYEPVVPSEANNIIMVAGLDALGKSIGEAVHRPELFSLQFKCNQNDIITIDIMTKAISALALATRVYLNEAESGKRKNAAKGIAKALNIPAAMGSLIHDGGFICPL